MLDKLNQGIFIIDSNNRIILINNKTEELLNLPKESITQLTWKEWLEKMAVGRLSRAHEPEASFNKLESKMAYPSKNAHPQRMNLFLPCKRQSKF